MTIDLSGDRERLVRSLMTAGGFASENDVVDEALRLLEERFEQVNLADLRREIAVGIEQADRGGLAPFDPLATLAGVRASRATDSESA